MCHIEKTFLSRAVVIISLIVALIVMRFFRAMRTTATSCAYCMLTFVLQELNLYAIALCLIIFIFFCFKEGQLEFLNSCMAR